MKKILSVLLATIFTFSVLAIPASAASDYVIRSPYEDVIWEGEGAWQAYKGNLHTHSTVSDGDLDFNEMVLEHYRQGFDFLAMTEHGVTGKAWNEKPTKLPLYLYQYLIGNKMTPLTDEEFEAVTTGTYPVNGTPRGNGMTCVVGGNELNALTITKCHVNGMFLPEGVGDNYLGYENDHEGAVKLTEKNGGISFINHPGDWLHSNRDRAIVSDPKNVHYFADIILKYDSCMGMEVFNERNGVTPYDRVLWDNVLMECLPYGKNVIAYSNNDAHTYRHVDSSYAVYMMPDNTQNRIKEAMQTGTFFPVTRNLRNDDILGPAEPLDANGTDLPYPTFTKVAVDGHKVTVKAKDCYNIQWVANGQIIASQDVAPSSEETTYVLDLDTIEGAEDFLYIRCQLLGEGGCTLTQALVIDNGTAPKKYAPDTSAKAKWQNFLYRLSSTRIGVLIQLIIDKLSK